MNQSASFCKEKNAFEEYNSLMCLLQQMSFCAVSLVEYGSEVK